MLCSVRHSKRLPKNKSRLKSSKSNSDEDDLILGDYGDTDVKPQKLRRSGDSDREESVMLRSSEMDLKAQHDVRPKRKQEDEFQRQERIK
jgi:hypothetical protein